LANLSASAALTGGGIGWGTGGWTRSDGAGTLAATGFVVGAGGLCAGSRGARARSLTSPVGSRLAAWSASRSVPRMRLGIEAPEPSSDVSTALRLLSFILLSSFRVQAVVPPSLPSWGGADGGDARERLCGKTSCASRAGAGPTRTAAVFAQRARRFMADFPHESLASLQEYDGRTMAARL